MSIQPQRYQKKTEPVEGFKVDIQNYKDVSRWCGGSTSESEGVVEIRVPSLAGTQIALNGDYVYRELETGAFSTMDEAAFEKIYHRVGLRQEGINIHSSYLGRRGREQTN